MVFSGICSAASTRGVMPLASALSALAFTATGAEKRPHAAPDSPSSSYARPGKYVRVRMWRCVRVLI